MQPSSKFAFYKNKNDYTAWIFTFNVVIVAAEKIFELKYYVEEYSWMLSMI